jgi:tryptophan synthase alpha chain
MNAIEIAFQRLAASGHTALMPFLTVGYPERDSILSLVPAVVSAGADLIELGMPFSDPLADGATLQAASQRALENGMTLRRCLDQIRTLRHQGIEVPFILMGYYNPFLQFGIEQLAAEAATSGVHGFIIPDLPPEEAEPVRRAFEARGLDLVFLLAPTADEARIQTVTGASSGFIYLVSLLGVTGARDSFPPNLAAFVRRVRAFTETPLAVGFGISTPEQAALVGDVADGVIVGSALIKEIGSAVDPQAAAGAFVAALRAGLDRGV